jgi:hypothetical protein
MIIQNNGSGVSKWKDYFVREEWHVFFRFIEVWIFSQLLFIVLIQ